MSAVLPALSSILFPRYWNLSHSFQQLSVIDNELVWLQRPLGAAGCMIRSGSGGSYFKRHAVHRSLPQLWLNMQQVLEKSTFSACLRGALWFPPPPPPAPPLKLCLQGQSCLFFFHCNWKVSCKQQKNKWEQGNADAYLPAAALWKHFCSVEVAFDAHLWHCVVFTGLWTFRPRPN